MEERERERERIIKSMMQAKKHSVLYASVSENEKESASFRMEANYQSRAEGTCRPVGLFAVHRAERS